MPGRELASHATTGAGDAISSTVAGWVSLLISLHLFCVAVALFSNQYASVLQMRLVRTLAPYGRAFNFDPNFTAGFHLTHGLEFEDDHVVEIELEGSPKVLRFPDDQGGDTGWRGGFRRQRWRVLARRLAAYTSSEDDAMLAELAASIGRHFFAESDRQRLKLRCLRRPPQPLNQVGLVGATGDELRPYESVYAADVFQDSSGVVRVIKQVASREAAPVEKAVAPRGRNAAND